MTHFECPVIIPIKVYHLAFFARYKPSKYNIIDPSFYNSRSSKVKSNSAAGLLIYNFLLVFNRNIKPNSARLRDTGLQYLSDLELDLLISLKVKFNYAFWIPRTWFLWVFNSKMWTNSAPLRDTRKIWMDLTDLVMLLTLKSHSAVGLLITSC